ncbi:hypothetical protein RYX36_011418, partial [Vicia faba]
GHSVAVVGKRSYIFCGCGKSVDNNNKVYYNDLYILDIDTGIGTNVTTTTKCPSARFSVAGDCLDPFKGGHSATVVGKQSYIFGGCGKSADNNNKVYYNDLYILDIDTGIGTNVTTTTKCPSARFSVAGDCLDPFKG